MVYRFTRGNESLMCDVREVSPLRFELILTGPDGIERMEHFHTADALHERQLMLEHELLAQGWAGPHGWNV
jgi:hypothetical protein